jgi:glucose/arabinose dehydrogenase
MTRTWQSAALAAAMLYAGGQYLAGQTASAQPAQPGANLEKLQQFKSTGTPLEMEKIAQGGPMADSIKKSLAKIKLPSGFKISLYAIVPDARHMAVGTNAGVVFVGTRKTKVYAVTDRDRDRVADEVKTFAPSVKMEIPNGVCFSKDGFLYIAERNRVLVLL